MNSSLYYLFQGKPVGRPRKNFPATSTSLSNNSKSINITSTPKSVGHPISRNLTGVMQQGIGKSNHTIALNLLIYIKLTL